jgi:hypothetical protein
MLFPSWLLQIDLSSHLTKPAQGYFVPCTLRGCLARLVPELYSDVALWSIVLNRLPADKMYLPNMHSKAALTWLHFMSSECKNLPYPLGDSCLLNKGPVSISSRLAYSLHFSLEWAVVRVGVSL